VAAEDARSPEEGVEMTQGAEPRERRVPFGIWAVAILTVALSILLLLDAAGIRPSNSNTILARATGTARFLDWIVGGIAVVGIAAAVALVRLMPIGYVLTIVLAGVGLLNAIASQLVGLGDDLRLGLLVVVVLYLNQPEVRAVFGRGDVGERAVPRGAEGE
jgi:hypothetical protein